jgi:hypothetical protein
VVLGVRDAGAVSVATMMRIVPVSGGRSIALVATAAHHCTFLAGRISFFNAYVR